ncbi:MAG: cache domain-containing protein, partial [Treponemataceae bacterium]|nr:cache domain-containing protein [Treponemataceae bacterium]
MERHKKIGILIEEFLNNLTIDKKLLVLYCVSFLLPMLIIVTMLTTFLYQNFLEKDLLQAEGNVKRLEKSLSQTMEKVVNLSDRLYANDRIHQAVLKEYHSVTEVFQEYAQLTFLDDFLRLHPEIACIRLFVGNPSLLNNSYFIQTTETIRELEWYKRTVALNGRLLWSWQEDVISKNKYISLFRLIRKPITGQYIGVLCI